MIEDGFKKITRFRPAYDKRSDDPEKNYGIHGVDILFVLKGEKGAVQFLLFTNWQLPHIETEFKRNFSKKIHSKLTSKKLHANLEHGTVLLESVDQDIEKELDLFWTPSPADLGYHSPKPMFEGHESIIDSCEFLDGKPCYYDGSSLNADSVFETLLKEGSEGVWRELENYYREIFLNDS